LISIKDSAAPMEASCHNRSEGPRMDKALVSKPEATAVRPPASAVETAPPPPEDIPPGEKSRPIPPARLRRDPDAIRRAFETGEFPYQTRLATKQYEAQMSALQIELLKAQSWVKQAGERIILIFEGRDAAGKGGTIKRFMEHLNPRGARVKQGGLVLYAAAKALGQN
jgi:hypothetical protein